MDGWVDGLMAFSGLKHNATTFVSHAPRYLAQTIKKNAIYSCSCVCWQPPYVTRLQDKSLLLHQLTCVTLELFMHWILEIVPSKVIFLRLLTLRTLYSRLINTGHSGKDITGFMRMLS